MQDTAANILNAVSCQTKANAIETRLRRKNWPQYELNGLTAKEIDGKKVILPIWHQVDKKEVLKYSPTLADKVALDTSKLKLREIAKELSNVLFDL